MSDIYYMIIDNELHLTSDDQAGFRASTIKFDDIGRMWPWTGNVDITKVVIDDPIQLPPDSSGLFAKLAALTEIDGLENLDTSQVTNMYMMFDTCYNLINLDLSGFDTSHVTNMSDMFFDCPSLRHVSLSDWDVSNVTDMSEMFYACESLTTIDLSGFDTSHVTDMSDMFYGCESLQSVTTTDQRIIAELPDGVSVEAPTTQEPTMADEASRAVSIEGGPSEPKPQTR